MDRPPPIVEPAALCALTHTLTDESLQHATAAIALSGTLAPPPGDPAAAGRWLAEFFDDAARPLFGIAAGELPEQAEALADAVARWLPRCEESGEPRTLLLGPALEARAADPLLLCIVGHELARRAGLRSVVARGAGHDWTVLADRTHCLPIGYGVPAPPTLDIGRLRACCAHEYADRVLARLASSRRDATALAAATIRAMVGSCAADG